jgi:glycosyltransferase involved in cell wall biosynthesis
MRILLISDHYPPFVGGVQRQTRALARALAARGHEVAVATVWQDDLPGHEQPDGFPVWRVRQLRTIPGVRGRPRRRHQAPGPDPVTALALRRVIRRFAPDIVHSSGWISYSAAAALLGLRPPLLVSAREYGFICANASLLHKGEACSGPSPAKCLSCSRWYFGLPRGPVAVAAVYGAKPLLRHRADALHSVSRYIGDLVAPEIFGARRGQILEEVIPSFRTPQDDDPDDAILARLPAEPFILFVGALRRVKGVEVLLEAYRRLRRAPALVLLGTIEADTPASMPDGALALGAASYATVMAAWDRSLFGVMPSLWPEPFGSVVHEAMSRGRAVIGTWPGGHADIIEDGRSGLLVRSGDVDGLNAAMQRLLDDPRLRESLGQAAAQRAESFTAELVIPRFERLYERVCDRRRERDAGPPRSAVTTSRSP